MIFYYFYDMVEQAFSFVKNVFLLLFITIIVCSVLIGCPYLEDIMNFIYLIKVLVIAYYIFKMKLAIVL